MHNFYTCLCGLPIGSFCVHRPEACFSRQEVPLRGVWQSWSRLFEPSRSSWTRTLPAGPFGTTHLLLRRHAVRDETRVSARSSGLKMCSHCRHRLSVAPCSAVRGGSNHRVSHRLAVHEPTRSQRRTHFLHGRHAVRDQTRVSERFEWEALCFGLPIPSLGGPDPPPSTTKPQPDRSCPLPLYKTHPIPVNPTHNAFGFPPPGAAFCAYTLCCSRFIERISQSTESWIRSCDAYRDRIPFCVM